MSDSTQARSRQRSGWWQHFWRRSERRQARHAVVTAEDNSQVLPAAERTLDESHEHLADRTRQTEPDFVQLAAALRELHTGAAQLNRVSSTTIHEVGQTLRHARLGGDDGLVAQSLRELTAGVEGAATQLQALQRTSTSLVHLHDESEHLARIALVLKSSCCSFAVESARSPELQQAFGAFVAELRQLASKIAEVAQTVGDHSRSVHLTQQQSIGSLQAGLGELRQLVDVSTRTVRSASTRIQTLLDSSQAAMAAAESRTSRIGSHADAAVYFMQFGDIVRQKLEHVAEALARGTSDATAVGDDAPSARAARLLQILAVQIAQLEAIRAELRNARTQLSNAFSGLADETELLVADLQGLADQHGGSEGDDGFQRLHRDLAELQQLHARGHALHQHARETAAQAAHGSSLLARHLGEIEQVNLELHRQALNAIVKTAWLGAQGRTLGVLAAHVHEVSQQSSLAVSQLLPHLEHLRTGAAASDEASDHRNPARSGSDELPQHLAAVHLLQERFRATSTSAAQLADAQRQSLERAQARLECLDTLAEDVSALIETLTALPSDLRPIAGDAAVTVETPLAASYTMESEREVHRRAMGDAASATIAIGGVASAAALSITSSDSPAQPATPTPDQSLGDNVELF
jgi:hypothetical protein